MSINNIDKRTIENTSMGDRGWLAIGVGRLNSNKLPVLRDFRQPVTNKDSSTRAAKLCEV